MRFQFTGSQKHFSNFKHYVRLWEIHSVYFRSAAFTMKENSGQQCDWFVCLYVRRRLWQHPRKLRVRFNKTPSPSLTYLYLTSACTLSDEWMLLFVGLSTDSLMLSENAHTLVTSISRRLNKNTAWKHKNVNQCVKALNLFITEGTTHNHNDFLSRSFESWVLKAKSSHF